MGGGGVGVDDVDASVVEVEPERPGITGAEGEAGVGFGGVGETHHLVEVEGAVFGGDVAQDAAGADRSELLVVADEADAGALVETEGDHVVQRQGVGHAGLIDDDQGVGPDH